MLGTLARRRRRRHRDRRPTPSPASSSGSRDQLDAAARLARPRRSPPRSTPRVRLLEQLLDAIQARSRGLDANPALIDLGVMKSDQTISRVGHQVTSTVTNELAGVSLLGGLDHGRRPEVQGRRHRWWQARHRVGHPRARRPHRARRRPADPEDRQHHRARWHARRRPRRPTCRPRSTTRSATVLDLLRTTLGLEFLSGTVGRERRPLTAPRPLTTVNAAKLILSPPLLASAARRPARSC